jgi:hypothetical protein
MLKEVKCTKCYDKGFSTVYQGGVYLMPDFCGDKKVCLENQGVKIKYCTCLNGKRLKHKAQGDSKKIIN